MSFTDTCLDAVKLRYLVPEGQWDCPLAQATPRDGYTQPPVADGVPPHVTVIVRSLLTG
jgi:hypothetical protein